MHTGNMREHDVEVLRDENDVLLVTDVSASNSCDVHQLLLCHSLKDTWLVVSIGTGKKIQNVCSIKCVVPPP